MKANLRVGWGWVPKTFPSLYLNTSDMCFSKISPLHKSAIYIYIYIVPRPNLGSGFIFHLPPDPLQVEV